jgi:hypothetical protein
MVFLRSPFVRDGCGGEVVWRKPTYTGISAQ